MGYWWCPPMAPSGSPTRPPASCSAARRVGSEFGTPLSDGTMEIDLVRRGEPAVAELRVMDTEWEGEAARIVSLRDITDRRQEYRIGHGSPYPKKS